MGIFLLQNIFEIMSKSIKLEKMSLQNFYKKRTQNGSFFVVFLQLFCVFLQTIKLVNRVNLFVL